MNAKTVPDDLLVASILLVIVLFVGPLRQNEVDSGDERPWPSATPLLRQRASGACLLAMAQEAMPTGQDQQPLQ